MKPKNQKGGIKVKEKKEFSEPLLVKYKEKLDEVTMGVVPCSCPTDSREPV